MSELLGAIRAGHVTVPSLSAWLGWSPQRVSAGLGALRARRLVQPIRVRGVTVWRPAAPGVRTRALVARALPGTAAEVAQAAGVTPRRVRQVLREMGAGRGADGVWSRHDR